MYAPVAQFFSIDVECVACGTDHNSRTVGQISLVDQFERVMLNIYVKPAEPVVSYLTPLTGLTKEILDARGVPLQHAVSMVRQHLPKHAILVGQNIAKDVQWLGLQEGTDFQQMMDLTGLFRVWNTKYKSFSVFGQDHLAKVLLQWDTKVAHDAVGDAIKSIRLFNLYQQYHNDTARWEQIQQQVLNVEPEPSFAKLNPSFEGVCQGNKRSCTCGAPFFF